MLNLKKIYKKDKNLHHAYLIVGANKNVLVDLFEFLEKQVGVETHGNPDFFLLDVPGLGIDEGRLLKEMQTRKSFSGGQKIFVISANTVTREAQNSLLKVFEEPTLNTHVFLILPTAEILLPTLRSRLNEVSLESEDGSLGDPNFKLAKIFLYSKPGDRLKLVESIISEKDKAGAINFLNGLEKEVLAVARKKNSLGNVAKNLEEIIKFRGYLNDRSPSVKIILEHLAVTLPLL